jgi:hypothetical protein
MSMSSTMGLTNPSAGWAPRATPRRSLGEVRTLSLSSQPREPYALLPAAIAQRSSSAPSIPPAHWILVATDTGGAGVAPDTVGTHQRRWRGGPRRAIGGVYSPRVSRACWHDTTALVPT